MIANLLEKISELEQQIVELRAEAEKEEKEKDSNKRWRAEKGCAYWLVECGGKPKWWHENSRYIDDFYYDTHNYFQTEEEAQKYANVIETERQLKKFADEHNDNKIDWNDNNSVKYYLCYNYNAHSIFIDSVWAIREPRVIYFSSKEIAKQAIDEIGAEKIKEYLTYEW